MKHKSLLYRLVEENSPQKERLNARLRKRKQRQKEQAIRETSPLNMILVVRNKQNGEILIIDKESYDPRYHDIVIQPEKLTQGAVQQILKDPKFVQTETSKRLFGDVKQDEPKQPKKNAAEEESPSGAGGQEEGSPAPMVTPAPKREIPFTTKNVSSGPIIALSMMAGMREKDFARSGITPEQLNEYNSSQEIQEQSNKIASQMAFFFKNIVGRNILEYSPMLLEGQMFQTTDEWKKLGGFDSLPKATITFRHKCVEESLKNKGKECAETMCGCAEAGIVPSEYQIAFTIKIGSSSLTNGKINNESKTILYSTITNIDAMLGVEQLPPDFNAKEKKSLKYVKKDIKFIKDLCKMTYEDEIKRNTFNKKPEDIMKSIRKLSEKVRQQIEKTINENILYKELFFMEAVTGLNKFRQQSPAYAGGIMAVAPESFDIKMEKIDLNFARKTADMDPKFVIKLKTQIEESPDEKAELESCKVRFGGKCPKLLNSKNFLIRDLLKSYIQENRYEHSNLKYLFEQTSPEEAQEQFFGLIEKSQTIFDLMMMFAIVPEQITISPIDFTSIVAIDYSAERNIIRVNGKRFEIPIQIDPIIPDDSEQIYESSSILKTLLERKKRNYHKEYEEYHGKPEQRANRSKRVLARRKMIRAGKAKKGDGKDVDHVNGDPQDNSMKNLRVVNRSYNRGKK